MARRGALVWRPRYVFAAPWSSHGALRELHGDSHYPSSRSATWCRWRSWTSSCADPGPGVGEAELLPNRGLVAASGTPKQTIETARLAKRKQQGGLKKA